MPIKKNKKTIIKVNPSKKYRLILSAVHMVYRLVNSTFTVDELTLRLTRLLCQFVRASSASIYLLDSDKRVIIMEASFNNQINILKTKRSELKNIDPSVMRVAAGDSIYQDDCIALPLIGDDYLGALVVRRNKGESSFQDFDREMLSVFAEQAVTAIRNLQLISQHEQVILGSIKTLGNMLQSRPFAGYGHPPVYLEVVKALAIFLKFTPQQLKHLEYASILHDVGVVDIPETILSKRGSLSHDEIALIRRHTVKSVDLIKPVEFLQPVMPMILHHHERYDGTGYPSGLKKEEIPVGARLLAVVDAFEAMLQVRPWRPALTLNQALDEILEKSGTQFDPKIVDAFLVLSRQKNFRKILSVFNK